MVKCEPPAEMPSFRSCIWRRRGRWGSRVNPHLECLAFVAALWWRGSLDLEAGVLKGLLPGGLGVRSLEHVPALLAAA